MKLTDLMTSLDAWDRKGRRVFTTEDLRKICDARNAASFAVSVSRFTNMENPPLKRVARGVYVNMRSRRESTHLLEEVARTIRRGARNYVSFESALSEYGWISQIPMRHLTIATNSRSALFQTEFGTIEFTQVRHPPEVLFDNLLSLGRPLPIAKPELAFADLTAVNRNLHLVQRPDEIDELMELRP